MKKDKKVNSDEVGDMVAKAILNNSALVPIRDELKVMEGQIHLLVKKLDEILEVR